MKKINNHRELMEALLSGETVIEKGMLCPEWSLDDKGFIQYEEGFEVIPYQFSDIYIKQRTKNINGFEVPYPETSQPKRGAKYWLVKTDIDNETYNEVNYIWVSTAYELIMLQAGLVHLSYENMLLHKKALLSFFKDDGNK